MKELDFKSLSLVTGGVCCSCPPKCASVVIGLTVGALGYWTGRWLNGLGIDVDSTSMQSAGLIASVISVTGVNGYLNPLKYGAESRL